MIFFTMKVALMVAAGKGQRMGSDKLWLELDGLPVVAHTWRHLDQAASVDQVVLVVRNESRASFEALGGRLGLRKPYTFVDGGAERQDSVWAGLQSCPSGTQWVAIQDAARPCTSSALIDTCFQAAERHGAVVAAHRVADTLKRVDDGDRIEETVNREGLWAVQTPQVFSMELIVRALTRVRSDGRVLTDDTAACEHAGIPVWVVESAQPNPKVTYPSDLPFVSWLLAKEKGQA